MELIVIDEIGKMKLFSNRFRSLVRDVLNSDKQLLASIALGSKGFIRDIKQRSDMHLLEVTQGNSERLPEAIKKAQAIHPGLCFCSVLCP